MNQQLGVPVDQMLAVTALTLYMDLVMPCLYHLQHSIVGLMANT